VVGTQLKQFKFFLWIERISIWGVLILIYPLDIQMFDIKTRFNRSVKVWRPRRSRNSGPLVKLTALLLPRPFLSQPDKCHLWQSTKNTIPPINARRTLDAKKQSISRQSKLVTLGGTYSRPTSPCRIQGRGITTHAVPHHYILIWHSISNQHDRFWPDPG
jgi:hypothetical protein